MMDWIVTRHYATAKYIEKKAKLKTFTRVDRVSKGVLEDIKRGDRVYGILPIYLAQKIIEKGAEYYAIILPKVNPDKWNKELTQAELIDSGIEIHKIKNLQMVRVQ